MSSGRAIGLDRFDAEQEVRQLPGANSTDAAQRLYQRVRGAGMAVRRQELKRFQAERRSHHDGDNQQYAVGIGQRERKANQRESGEMFQM